MFFTLNENMFIVDGKDKFALHDFNQKKLYMVNIRAGELLNMLTQGNSLEECLEITGLDKEKTIAYLNGLESKSLGKISDVFTRQEESLWQFLERRKIKENRKINFTWLEITNNCNLRCIHCYNNSGPKVKTECSINFYNIVEQVKQLGCKKIQFTGGEPLIEKDLLLGLMDYVNKRQFEYKEIYSNLNLLDQDIIDSIVKNDFHIATSIYGHNESVHDAITTVPGSFNKTINSVKKLKEMSVDIRVGIVLVDTNYKYRKKIVSFVKKMGIRNVKVDIVRGAGRGSVLFSEDFKNRKASKNSSCSNIICTKEFFWDAHLGHNCFSNHVCVNSAGDVFPCVMERNSLGNMTQQPLSQILETDNAKKIRETTKDSISGCNRCELRYVCFDCRTERKSEDFFSQTICDRYP